MPDSFFIAVDFHNQEKTMSFDTFEVWGLDAVTILSYQDWSEGIDDDAYQEALSSIVAYLNHAAAE